MNITAKAFGYGEKRWYHKVVKTAQAKLSEKLHTIQAAYDYEYLAEFDSSAAHLPRIATQSSDDLPFDATVTFASSEWQSVNQATPSAIAQLAGVMVHITAHEPFNTELQLALNQERIQFTGVVETAPPELKIDPRNHVVVFFDPSLVTNELVADLYDSLDKALTREHLGEVTGSGHGVLGTTLDVALNDLEMGTSFLRDFLKTNGAPENTRIKLEGSEQSWLLS